MNTNLEQFKAQVEAVKGDKKALAALVLATRLQFRDNLGLPKSTVNTGYKFQKVADQTLMEKVIDAKMKFEVIVEVTGKGQDVLRKMTRNLANADRASVFAQIEREAKKKAKAEAAPVVESVPAAEVIVEPVVETPAKKKAGGKK